MRSQSSWARRSVVMALPGLSKYAPFHPTNSEAKAVVSRDPQYQEPAPGASVDAGKNSVDALRVQPARLGRVLVLPASPADISVAPRQLCGARGCRIRGRPPRERRDSA